MKKGFIGAFFSLLLIVFGACSVLKPQYETISDKLIRVDESIDSIAKRDTSFTNLIYSFKKDLDAQMNVQISFAPEELSTSRPEGILGNYIADAFMQVGQDYCIKKALDINIDLCVVNMGGIRTSIPQGKVTVGNLFETLPFKNVLVIVKMKGSDLKDLIDHLAKRRGEAISGASFGISEDYKAMDIMIGDEKLDVQKQYYVLSLDYLVSGGDGMSMFKNNIEFINTKILCRDAAISYIKSDFEKGNNMRSQIEGRVYYEQ